MGSMYGEWQTNDGRQIPGGAFHDLSDNKIKLPKQFGTISETPIPSYRGSAVYNDFTTQDGYQVPAGLFHRPSIINVPGQTALRIERGGDGNSPNVTPINSTTGSMVGSKGPMWSSSGNSQAFNPSPQSSMFTAPPPINLSAPGLTAQKPPPLPPPFGAMQPSGGGRMLGAGAGMGQQQPVVLGAGAGMGQQPAGLQFSPPPLAPFQFNIPKIDDKM